MIFIAHRGNTGGVNPNRENDPAYLDKAIMKGFDVEADIWFHEGKFYLGHLGPDHRVNNSFILKILPNCWFHAKDALTVFRLLTQYPKAICFYQDQEPFTITSNGYIWCHSYHNVICPRSIIVLPEANSVSSVKGCAGICSDEVESYCHV